MGDGGNTQSEEAAGRLRRLGRRLRAFDTRPGVVGAAQSLRNLLPGDRDYGDPLSVAGDEPPHAIGKRLSQLAAKQPSALHEVGMGALQVWQSVSEAGGRGKGHEELAIVFTDLVEFSDWALEAGDDDAVELLRCVGRAVEPVIERGGGRVVKRLGDGLMAVFDEPSSAVEAALEAAESVGDVEVAGYTPRLRAGVHLGKPRKLGGDYFGVDVNVAARVAAAAGPGEVLVSQTVCDKLDGADVSLRRKWRFKAKGAPKDLSVFSASAAE